jgi:hypothetical protein
MLTTWKWPPTTGTTTKQQYKNNTTSEERRIYLESWAFKQNPVVEHCARIRRSENKNLLV